MRQRVLVLKTGAHHDHWALWSGFIQWWHYAGNAFADRLADKGAELAAVHELAKIKRLEGTCHLVQKRLIAIICGLPKRVKPPVVRPAASAAPVTVSELLQTTAHVPVQVGTAWKCTQCLQTASALQAASWLKSG
eukprot:1441004-Karenia_brevis.AAC.1